MKKGRYFGVKIKEKDTKKEQRTLLFLVGVISAILVTVIGGSYAFFSIVVGGNKKVTVEVGTFEVSFADQETIQLENAYPVSDIKGMTNPSYQFTVKNTGTVNALYDLSFEEQSVTKNTLNKKYIKYSIKEGLGEWSTPQLLSSLNNLVLVSGKNLNAGINIDYQIKIWLDENANNDAQGKEFKAKLVLNAVQGNATTNDTTPPEIKLAGDLSMNIKQGSTFTDPGVSSVTDDKDTLDKANVTKTYEYYGTYGLGKGPVEISTRNDSTYPWINNNEVWSSTNQNIHSSTTNLTYLFAVSENTTVSFDYSVSSESASYDYIYYTLYKDGIVVSGTGTATKIGGTGYGTEESTLNYVHKDIGLTAGTYELTFSYRKDGSISSGLDAGFVKNVAVDGVTQYIDMGTTLLEEVEDLDTSRIGSYYIYYKISDTKGNEGSVVRTVNVYKPDTKPPKITLNGDASQTIYLGTNYTDLGATAIDDIDGDISSNIVTMGTVNKNKEGTYVIKYLITDSSGNTSSVTRTVIVKEQLYILRAGSSSASQDFNKYRASITNIEFRQSEEVPSNVIESFEVQASTSDGKIYAYLVDDGLGANTHKLYIQSPVSKIYANPASNYLFYTFTKLSSINNLEYLDTSKATTMAYMFHSCSGFTNLDLSSFDTSSVTDMSYMLRGCSSLTNLNISNFDTSNVISMAQLFYNCSNLTSLELHQFNTSKVTSMAYMFYGCSKLANLELSSFNTHLVADMTYMFQNCSSLTSLDVSNLDTNNVTIMTGMFASCKGLTSLDVSNLNTSNVTIMSYMFQSCSALTSLDLRNFDTSKVTNMNNMFESSKNLTSLDISNLNTSNVIIMSGVFRGCTGLTSLDVSSFDTSKVTSMSQLFYDCTGLTSLDLSNFNTSTVTSMDFMFNNCNKILSLDLGHLDTAKVTTMTYMFASCNQLQSLDISNFNTSNVTVMTYMFSSCVNLTALDVSSFNTDKVTTMTYMFANCNKLQSLDLSNFNTSNLTTITYMFQKCSALTSLDLSNFNTSKVTSLYSTFNGCSNLINLNLSNFDTGNVTNMTNVFYDCTKLVTLDISNFNTTKVTTMQNMFRNCMALTSLDISDFDTSNVNSMSYMFSSCNSLSSLDVSGFNTSKVTSMQNMFQNYKGTTLNLSNFDTSNVTSMASMFINCSNITNLDLTSFNTSKVTTMNSTFYGTTSMVEIKVSSSTWVMATNVTSMFQNSGVSSLTYV